MGIVASLNSIVWALILLYIIIGYKFDFRYTLAEKFEHNSFFFVRLFHHLAAKTQHVFVLFSPDVFWSVE